MKNSYGKWFMDGHKTWIAAAVGMFGSMGVFLGWDVTAVDQTEIIAQAEGIVVEVENIWMRVMALVGSGSVLLARITDPMRGKQVV